MGDVYLRFASLLVSALFVTGPVKVGTQQSADRAIVTVEWSSPVDYTTSVDGRELLVQFGRPLDLEKPPDFDTGPAPWIEAVSHGFDTLLIRAARDASFSVSAAGPIIVIELTAPPRATDRLPAAPDDKAAELRLDLLRAQLAAAEGRWTRADRILARAVEAGPRGGEAADLRAQVRAEEGGRARLDVEVKDVQHAQRERITRVSTHGFIGGYTRIGGMVEDNQATLGGQVYGRQRAEAYLRKDFDSGSELRISAFGTRSSLGGAVHLGHADSTGRTLAEVEYRRPFWEFVEGLLGNGTRDRAEIRREQRFGSRVSGRAAAALNRYGLGGSNGIARSMALDAGLTVTPR